MNLVELPAFQVALADPDADRRNGLERALRSGGLEVTASRSDPGEMALALPADVEAAIVGMDALAPETLECVDAIRADRRNVRVVIVSDTLGNGPTREAFDMGVDAVVLARDAEQCLALAVRQARAGQLSVPKGWRRGFETPVLSRRQKQILAMVVMGFSNRRIARTLGVAESTVKSHLTSAFRRLGVSSRNEAAALILDQENGLGTGILGIPTDGSAPAPIRADTQENRPDSTDH